jgi:hypothetical protein
MAKSAVKKTRSRPSPSPVEAAPAEPVFQLGEAAQAAQERFNAHISRLLERLGCEVTAPISPDEPDKTPE